MNIVRNTKNWINILPEEIQQLIWKEVYKETLGKLHEFRMYKELVKQYIKRAIKDDDIYFVFDRKNDLFYSNRNGDGNIYINQYTTSTLSAMFSSPTIETMHGTISPKTQVLSNFNTCGIMDPLIIDTMPKMYGLCRPIPDNWTFIGRYNEYAARKFTYIKGIRKIYIE